MSEVLLDGGRECGLVTRFYSCQDLTMTPLRLFEIVRLEVHPDIRIRPLDQVIDRSDEEWTIRGLVESAVKLPIDRVPVVSRQVIHLGHERGKPSLDGGRHVR